MKRRIRQNTSRIVQQQTYPFTTTLTWCPKKKKKPKTKTPKKKWNRKLKIDCYDSKVLQKTTPKTTTKM